MRTLRRLLNLWRGDSLDREFDDEIEFHFEERIARNRGAGMSQVDAEAEARRHFGSRLRAREGMRDARVAAWAPAFGRDVRVAARMLRRQPGMAALAVLTLSLGIGANTAVFALVSGILIRPLPYADADRLVALIDTFTTASPRTNLTIPEFLDVRSATKTLQDVAFVDTRDFQIGGGTEPARVVGARSEASFLRTLGVRPTLGRLFDDQEGQPGAAPVVILTDSLWRANFGADRSIVGRRITLNGAPSEVVGVLPADFHFDFLADDAVGVYIPFPMIPVYTSRAAEFAAVRRVMVVGRMRPGTTVEQADADVQEVGRRVAEMNPALYRQGADRRDVGFVMRAEALQEYLFGGSRATVRLILAAVALLLLIACVNMAQFLFAQAVERRSELALRSALGAGRVRLVRQLVAESIVLAAVTAGAGLLQGAILIQLLRAQVASTNAFVASRIELSGDVALFAAGLALAVTALCHVLPIVRISHAQPMHVFTTRDAAPRTRTRHVMIAAQVTVTVMLLGIAGLLVHSITRLEAGDRGFTPDGITALRIRAPLRVQGGQIGVTYRDYLDRIRAVPDIASVAMASIPIPAFPGTNFSVGRAAADAATLSAQLTAYAMVSPDYFATLSIPVRRGRTFTNADAAGAVPVAIINEEMAKQYWPGQNPIGHEIRAGEGPRSALMTIVGVVGNVRPAMQLEPIPQIYVSYLQQPEPNMVLLVRARSGATPPLQAIKQAIWSVHPDQPVFDVRPLPDMLSRMTAEPRRSLAVLLGSIATLAVVISAAGMFTLVTYVTVRRRREVALRRVIGAGVADVLAQLSLPTFRWTCVGLAIGIAGAVVGGGVVRATYTGIAPANLALLGAIAGVYVLVAAAALCAPAAAALRGDPAAILRAE